MAHRGGGGGGAWASPAMTCRPSTPGRRPCCCSPTRWRWPSPRSSSSAGGTLPLNPRKGISSDMAATRRAAPADSIGSNGSARAAPSAHSVPTRRVATRPGPDAPPYSCSRPHRFEPGHLRSQGSDLGVELAKLFPLRRSPCCQLRVSFLEDHRQPFQSGGLPLPYQVGVDTVSGGDLGNVFLLPQELLDNLRFEGGAVAFSHALMIHPISASSTVQIYGSTIAARPFWSPKPSWGVWCKQQDGCVAGPSR